MRKLLATYFALALSGATAQAQYCSMGYVERIRGAHSRQAVLSIATQAEQFLYTPGSEGYDEDIFIEVLEAMMQSPVLTDADKQRPAALLELASKNRPGQVAADIAFVTPDGEKHLLSQIATPFTIVLFNNPDCDECAAIKRQLAADSTVQQMVAAGSLTIVGIYPYDDEALWRNTHYPETMVNGWDSEMAIEETESYNLTKIPSLYLLGEGRKVILKDATLPHIIARLSSH